MVGTEYLDAGHHVVQFYGHDEELAERVAGYLLGALRGGGVAIVIATEPHRRAFAARLTQAGVDPAAARDGGTYLALDAGDTMREFMTADGLDHAAFDRVIGGLIQRAGAAGRPVRAYGEMVALLWDDGLVNAAAELEAMWDDLGRRHPFALFCAYRADSVTRDGTLDAFAEVCRLHQEVIGLPVPPGPGPDTVQTFGLSRDAPAAARHYAVRVLSGLGADDLADDAALVVTELAANAVVHAHSGFTLVLSVSARGARISVRDASPLPGAQAGGSVPALPAAPLHGLGAVNAMASRWGVEPHGSAGKTVWVELRR